MNEITVNNPIATVKMYGILFVMFFVGIAMLVWPIFSLREMLQEIHAQANYVTLDKGAYYLFGGGLFFLTIVVGTVLSFFFRERGARQFIKYFGMSLIVSLMLVFILPQTVQYFTENYIFAKNYRICEAKSSQWLHAKTIAYAKTIPCD